jgi:Fanconi anemia group M protein
MTGNMIPKERDIRWKDRRVFFVTPQILANDIKRGVCNVCEITVIYFAQKFRQLKLYV